MCWFMFSCIAYVAAFIFVLLQVLSLLSFVCFSFLTLFEVPGLLGLFCVALFVLYVFGYLVRFLWLVLLGVDLL